MKTLQFARAALVACAALLASCATPEPQLDYRTVIVSEDRSDEDRVLDQRRNPQKLLQFYNVRPGMRVADLSAGRGYNSELLARVVGPTGRVYAHTSPKMSVPAAKVALEQRLKTPIMKYATLVERDFEDPLPPEARDLDMVTFNFNYHDTVWLGTDRARMNRAIFQALKPGGIYIVADHSAKPGAGLGVAKSLHRIEESIVVKEVLEAGFKLVEVGDFLRSPLDPREVPVFKNPVQNDEFVLKFMKPGGPAK
jgi:predicted methyltransferase